MSYGDSITTPNFANATGQTPAERWRFSTLNDMLLSIGQAGIDYNDSIMDTMEGQHALRVLTDVMYEVESEGWEFNTFNDLSLPLDENGMFSFDYVGDPGGNPSVSPHAFVFSLVGRDSNLFVSQSGQVKEHNNQGSVIVLGNPGEIKKIDNVIIDVWADMHHALSQYIAAVAVNRYQALMVGNAGAARFSEQDLAAKYGKARRDEIRTGKYNILTSNFGTEVNR